MPTLIIVESPAKARSIKGFLGRNYMVKASLGMYGICPSRFGVDLEKNFEPHYITIRGKGPVLKELRDAAKRRIASYWPPTPIEKARRLPGIWPPLYVDDDQCRETLGRLRKTP